MNVKRALLIAAAVLTGGVVALLAWNPGSRDTGDPYVPVVSTPSPPPILRTPAPVKVKPGPTPSPTYPPGLNPWSTALVHGDDYCHPAGAGGRTSDGTVMTCKESATDNHLRWRR